MLNDTFQVPKIKSGDLLLFFCLDTETESKLALFGELTKLCYDMK